VIGGEIVALYLFDGLVAAVSRGRRRDAHALVQREMAVRPTESVAVVGVGFDELVPCAIRFGSMDDVSFAQDQRAVQIRPANRFLLPVSRRPAVAFFGAAYFDRLRPAVDVEKQPRAVLARR
jgi:hypothetical protein